MFHDAAAHRKLDAILALLELLTNQGKTTMNDLSAIQSAVAAEGDVINSVVTLLGQLSAEVKASANDPAAVAAIAASIDQHRAALAAAVVANTPAAPAPAPAEPPPAAPAV